MDRPVEPSACSWAFPDPTNAPGDLVCFGGDLQPGTILAAYRAGLFPMPVNRRRLGWWSPNPRGVLPLDGLHVSRSLAKSVRRFEIRVDTAFVEVMRRCGDPKRKGGWITDSFIDSYTELHRLGWAHSVECWLDDELVGGLYGLAIGGLFAGESKFHTVTDASKAAVVATVHVLKSNGFTLFDVQWRTDHLATLGVIELPRRAYLNELQNALGKFPLFG